MSRIATLLEYYADPFVRERILEYCGATDGAGPTCVDLAGLTDHARRIVTWGRAPRYETTQLDTLLASGADISRSIWDAASLLIHLDFDYQNSDSPGEAYHHPAEVFFKLEPAYRAAQHVFHRFGLPLLTLMTGRGYHFTGQVPLDSPVVDRLAALAPGPPRWLATLPARRPPWLTAELSERHAKAHVGAGMLVEYLAHRILRRAEPRSPIPLVLNGVIVGTGLAGRECTSIDLSYAGDPMDVRHLRVAFGAYQKHRFRPDIVAHRGASERPPFIAVPRGDESLEHLLSHGREFAHAARAARLRSTRLPVVTSGIAALLDAYAASRLAHSHRQFYASPRRDVAEGDALFRALPASLPGCVTRPLVTPNDWLLQPTSLQHVTRALMADGMPPRDIAAIVHARYAADCGWGRRWAWLDAETRAEFDVRVFAGLIEAGVDRAIDFNCTSAQEKDLCPRLPCGLDLRVDRDRLLEAVPA
ncbi:MAG: hypothetical protein LAO77_03115 [Acidobacteriia bacterium]|nr:hypothetical protein [Terriglobia bacterium]